jgi:hypothetical protein
MSNSQERNYQKGAVQYKHPRNSDDFLRDSVLGNTIVKPGIEGGLGL